MSNRYFINVKDEDLLPQAKKNFDELRRDILNYFSMDDSNASLSEMLIMVNEDYSDTASDFFEDYVLFDTTLMVALYLDREHGTESAFNLCLELNTVDIEDNISSSGIGIIWRALLIKEEKKEKYMPRFLSDFKLDFEENRIAPYKQSDLSTIGQLIRLYSLMTPDYMSDNPLSQAPLPIRIMASKDVLNKKSPEEIADVINQGHEHLSNDFGWEGNDDHKVEMTLFLWLKTLCQRGIMEGYQESFVLDVARKGTRAIIEKINIKEPGVTEIMERRALVNIAYGFEGFMKRIGVDKKDIMPVSLILPEGIPPMRADHYNTIDRDVLSSPVTNRLLYDRINYFHNEVNMLSSLGIDLNADELLTMEANNGLRASLLGGRISTGDDIWKEIASNPKFFEIKNLVITDYAYTIENPTTEFFVAVGERASSKKLTIANFPEEPSEESKKLILELISRKNLFSDRMVKFLYDYGFNNNDLIPYITELTSKSKKDMIYTDMGL